jgi:hypothetical protein
MSLQNQSVDQNPEAVTMTAKKAGTTKISSFKAWLEAKPYWEQFLWQLHLEKDLLEKGDIENCYQYLLEDYGVVKTAPGRTPIAFSNHDLVGAEASATKSTLDKIENLRDVHDMASGVNPSVPKNGKLELELKKLDDFIVVCQP